VQAAATLVEQDRQEAGQERDRREDQAGKPHGRSAGSDGAAVVGGTNRDSHQARAWRLSGGRPEGQEIAD